MLTESGVSVLRGVLVLKVFGVCGDCVGYESRCG